MEKKTAPRSITALRQEHETIKEKLESMKFNANAIDQFAVQAKLAVTDKKERELRLKVEDLGADNMKTAKDVKAQLDAIKAENDRFGAENEGSALLQIRQNLFSTSCRRYSEAVTVHHDSLNGFRDALRDREHRQLEIVDPSLTRKQVDELIDSGQAMEFVQRKLVSPNMQQMVEEIEARHLEIRKLEQDVETLSQLFQDLALLIDNQQEVLNSIQHNIETAKGHVDKGEDELRDGAKFQNKSRKTKFAIGATLAALLAVVVGPTAAAVAV